MGLCRSKHKPGKGEEQKGCPCSGPKPKERSMDRHSQDSEKPLDTKPAEGFSWKKGAAKQQWRSPEFEETPVAKVKLNKKEVVIPQIIITRASNETLISYSSIGNEEQRTIREQTEWGPYARHRNPSTVDAYALQTKQPSE